MWLTRVSVMLLTLSSVFCQDCVIRNFGEDFHLFSSGTGVCGSMAGWRQGSYSSINMDSPHNESTSFITPQATLSCLTSDTFTMAANGVLQLRLYLFPRTFSDYVTVIVYEAKDSISIVGHMSINLSDSNFLHGWNTLSVTLAGDDSYEGYVAVVGTAANSDVLVDYLRYIPPTIATDNAEELCPVYTDAEGVEEDLSNSNCIVYDFESDYENLFSSDYVGCNGLDAWIPGNFVINSEQTSFIIPNGVAGCTASSLFEVETGGTLEINLFMLPLSTSDGISVIIIDSENTFIASTYYHSNSANFVNGWSTLTLPVNINDPRNIQIVFIGAAAHGSIILVESFKFVSTSYADGDECSSFNNVAITTSGVFQKYN